MIDNYSEDSAIESKIALVTGAAGFIGSHLVDRLIADGLESTARIKLNETAELFSEYPHLNRCR